MWKVTKHKDGRSRQDLMVAARIRELAMFSGATYAESMIREIKAALETIPRKNNFSADLMYKTIIRNEKSLEVWKMTSDGDLNYKMVTLDYDKPTPDPFNS